MMHREQVSETPQDLESFESEVRSYSRYFPNEFRSAKDCYIFDSKGRRYIDLLSCCGSINYGHNNSILKQSLLSYIDQDGMAMSLDLLTESRRQFLESFREYVLKPRNLNYKVQFPGPTGTNAIEAAIKLARKVTGRLNIVAFTNAFHGCTLGSLSMTASGHHRASSRPLLGSVSRFPYDKYLGDDFNSTVFLETMLDDPASGIDPPAAILVETIQGEGGLNVASSCWMQQVARVAERHGALLIVDDIQAGCGRSGDFFSFESLGFRPDIVVLAKAISGYGLPMSLLLMDPAIDQWKPGEHNGTFRGNNFAFVTAEAAIRTYWKDSTFSQDVNRKSELLTAGVQQLAEQFQLGVRGRGMMQGLVFEDFTNCQAVQQECFNKGVIVETCGSHGEVLKFLPTLTMPEEVMTEALSIVSQAIEHHRGAACDKQKMPRKVV